MKTLAHRNIPITIVGGGIHGVSIAIRLLREVPTAARHLAIIDRHRQPLTQWRHKTERQGMTFLRSPAVHHISPDPLGIVEYAERHNRTDELAPPYSQPSTQLFWDFCKGMLAELKQHRVYHQFEVAKLRWDKGAGKFPFRLISENNEGFRSRCIILAIGVDDCAYVPVEFAQWRYQYPNTVLHASEFTVDCWDEQDAEESFVIVGGGLTAGTLARSLNERGHSVALIARKPLKTEQFDFPPIWLGPKALAEFASETDFHRRYEIIQQNRGEGSITPDIMEALEDASNIKIYPETQIQNIISAEEGNPTQGLNVKTNRGDIMNVSRVILATGYQFNLCRYRFLQELITQHQIPLVCGLPRLDADLQLYPIENLFGSGTIAQLQIGPASGNIAGASLAYERLHEKLRVHL
jgi:lysine/ornithine N-monooxygenase